MSKKSLKKLEVETPSDVCRKLRDAYWSKFDYDLKKVCEDVKKGQEKHKDRLIDVEQLRKKGIIK